MVRQSKTQRTSGRTILLVDDSAEYLETTRLLLEHEGHKVLCASNGPEALELLRERAVDLMLLDYYMPGMTGEEVVTQLRHLNPHVQVILQTGYASEQPPRELLRRLDIQGYYDKTEGPEKLLLWTDVGLRAAYAIQMLNKSRQGLRYILEVTPDLHKMQPLDDLLQGILFQVAGLLGATNSFLAVLPRGKVLRASPPNSESFLAMVEEETGLVIRAGTGRFVGHTKVEDVLESQHIHLVRETLQQGKIQTVETVTVVPLQVGESTSGVIYLDRPTVQEEDIELVHLFANQAAVAIQNVQLYEMATLDPLTGTYARAFLDKWLLRELRIAFRSQHPSTLFMIDLDGMKRINDTAGHLVGDQALATLGKVLRQATRTGDIVGRYGGDEFAILLPQAGAEGAEIVGHRILDSLQDKYVGGPSTHLPLEISLGYSVLESHSFAPSDLPHPIPQAYFQSTGIAWIQHADEALYRSKGDRKHQVCAGEPTKWLPVGAAVVHSTEMISPS